ncbi:uncharacterized protein LOC124443661 [Xenia sp. Carnegie-2017]|uniref:uncharacterized protein LOC124443661 n=1 Tax=Xenia sp. Carnegie-2017 TaxID=2897299 RepID=UPI001F04F4BE|nr:uncharacterized protein LOC124443661 [Xenia sp. Carnegie-2017]
MILLTIIFSIHRSSFIKTAILFTITCSTIIFFEKDPAMMITIYLACQLSGFSRTLWNHTLPKNHHSLRCAILSFCDKCQQYFSKENLHCDLCNDCPTKHNNVWQHCLICGKCVKKGYVHCEICKSCKPPGHDCQRV